MEAPSDSHLPSTLVGPCNPQQRHTFTQPSPSAKRPRLVAETLLPCLSIPGPAGAVQAALRRTHQIRETASEEDEIPTQRLIDATSKFDDNDFKRSCWVAAIGSTTTSTPLGSINNSPTQRLSMVVAMVTTCTPNGFGDLMATLKDPTATLSASIHRNVFTDRNHARDLDVGAVLVLQNVCVFSPRSDCYLNITKKNIVKIFPKDFESSSNNDSGSEAAIECRAPAAIVISQMAHNSSYSLGNGVASRVITSQVYGTAQGCASPLNDDVDKNSSIKDAASRVPQNMEKGKEPTRDTTLLGSSTDTNASTQASVKNDNYPPASLLKQPGQASSLAVESDGAIKQMHSLASLSSLPQWTDEQLEQLFVDD
uniref:Homologous recombination OB-fold protein OB-fold domain-containing protein n=1 Tax=Kalanchoe fedtschenkoi TaxID=63787 RepID=A0A7N0UHZ7_KALFE